MLTFRVESRIPVKLFTKAPFIYTGPDFMSFSLGMISDIIDYQGKKIQRFHPITVSKVDGDRIIDQMFCFGFLYIDNDGELAFYLTHPYWFDRSDIEECFFFFLEKVEELAKMNNIKYLKLELHDFISPPIAFPSSLSEISYDLKKIQINRHDSLLFKKHGFSEEESISCYENRSQNLNNIKKETHVSKDLKIRRMKLNDFMKIYGRTIEFPVKTYNLSNRDLFTSQKIIPYLNDTILVTYDKSVKSTNINGFLMWSPNLIELYERFHSPIPYMFYPEMRKHSFEYGKIFNFAIKKENVQLFPSLLCNVLQQMGEQGIKKCQIGYISDKQKLFIHTIEKNGFTKVHVMKILKKRVIN